MSGITELVVYEDYLADIIDAHDEIQ